VQCDSFRCIFLKIRRNSLNGAGKIPKYPRKTLERASAPQMFPHWTTAKPHSGRCILRNKTIESLRDRDALPQHSTPNFASPRIFVRCGAQMPRIRNSVLRAPFAS
jgi:hypothetical protein